MKDRVPTNVLSNGAVRYGVYDELGTLLRYEYIRKEDAPTETGTPLNKATLLSDATATLLGLTGDPTVNEALASLHINGTKIAYGSYVGTGVYGSERGNSLTFPFAPRVVIVRNADCGICGDYDWFLWTQNLTNHGTFYSDEASTRNHRYYALTDNTLSWYATCLDGQLNSAGKTYDYIAIGI